MILAVTSKYQVFQTSIIALAIAHYLLQPYCKTWLNIMDGLLLGCLSITSSLVLDDTHFRDHSTTNTVTVVLVYMSVMGPLCAISLGIVSIVLVRYGLMSKIDEIGSAIKWCQQRVKVKRNANAVSQLRLNTVTRSTLTVNDGTDHATGDREPLIHYLQDTTCYNATDTD